MLSTKGNIINTLKLCCLITLLGNLEHLHNTTMGKIFAKGCDMQPRVYFFPISNSFTLSVFSSSAEAFYPFLEISLDPFSKDPRVKWRKDLFCKLLADLFELVFKEGLKYCAYINGNVAFCGQKYQTSPKQTKWSYKTCLWSYKICSL